MSVQIAENLIKKIGNGKEKMKTIDVSEENDKKNLKKKEQRGKAKIIRHVTLASTEKKTKTLEHTQIHSVLLNSIKIY